MKLNYNSLPYILLCYSHFTHQFENFDIRGLKFQINWNGLGNGLETSVRAVLFAVNRWGLNFVNAEIRIVNFGLWTFVKSRLNLFWMKVGPKERPELLNLLLKLHKTAWNIRLIQLWISRFSWWHKKIDMLDHSSWKSTDRKGFQMLSIQSSKSAV